MSLDALVKNSFVTTPVVFQTEFQIWLSKLTGTRKQDIVFDLLVAAKRNVNGLEDAEMINGTCATSFHSSRSRFSAGDTIGNYMAARLYIILEGG
jgi:hypothetical protein